MTKGKPIVPSEVSELKGESIPEYVFDAFNKLIIKNWNGHSARIGQDEVIQEIVAVNGQTRQYLFANNFLDVEDSYRCEGWKVKYDKPAYNETYEAFFIFAR